MSNIKHNISYDKLFTSEMNCNVPTIYTFSKYKTKVQYSCNTALMIYAKIISKRKLNTVK